MSKLRFRVVETAFKKRAAEVPAPAERPSDYFGQNVFNRAKMFKYLPEKAYERITDCIDNGAPLDRETGTRRIQFSERRYPEHIRGTWLFRLGPLLSRFYRR